MRLNGGEDHRLAQSTVIIGAAEDEQATFITNLAVSRFDMVELPAHEDGGIEAVRMFASHMLLAPQHGERRLGVIYHADRLTPQAQNALLKLLEEPPQSAAIVLFVTTEHGILPTLYSRCSRYYGSQTVAANSDSYITKTPMERFIEAEAMAKDDEISHQILGWIQTAYTDWCANGRPSDGVALLEGLWQVYGDSKTNINKRLLLENLAVMTASTGE
jgi:hypothetical protein